MILIAYGATVAEGPFHTFMMHAPVLGRMQKSAFCRCYVQTGRQCDSRDEVSRSTTYTSRYKDCLDHNLGAEKLFIKISCTRNILIDFLKSRDLKVCNVLHFVKKYYTYKEIIIKKKNKFFENEI